MSRLVIDPGALDARLVLEAPEEVPDGAGGTMRSYEDVATLWASVEPFAARGEPDAVQAGQTVTHRIVMRHRDGVTTRHRLRDGTRVFRIVTVIERDRRFLEIRAEERTG